MICNPLCRTTLIWVLNVHQKGAIIPNDVWDKRGGRFPTAFFPGPARPVADADSSLAGMESL